MCKENDREHERQVEEDFDRFARQELLNAANEMRKERELPPLTEDEVKQVNKMGISVRGIDNFSKKHVILFSSIIFLFAMPVAWGLLYPVTHLLGNLWAETIQYTVTAVLSIVFMYCIWRTSIFSFRSKRFWKGLFSFGLLGVLGAIGAFIFSRDVIDLTPTILTFLSCVAMNLAIAVSEEFLFRGVILTAMLRAWNDKEHSIALATLVCSAIFGIRHLLNLITMPDTIILTLAQVVFTFMAGLYLCAVFLRTQNIWICIAIHFLEDFSVSIWEIFSSNAAASASMDGSVGTAMGMIALQIPYVIFAILMLRDKNWKYNSV